MAGNEDIERYLQTTNTVVDINDGLDFDEAMNRVGVPEHLQAAVRDRREQQRTQVIHRVRGVTRQGGPQDWWEDWDPAQGFYWPRQRAYLLDQISRSPENVDATDSDSDRVLSYLADPRRASGPEDFDVRGLVVGYVQSGKTENFSAVIAKSLDLGYGLIIVLSGVHNGLRQQTQRRLERELGISDRRPGVGRPPLGRRIVSLTQDALDGDFNRDALDPSILQGNERVIVVCKKWHTILSALNGFIDDADAPDLAVLIIDDEADQASINTGGNRAGDPEPPAVDGTDLEEQPAAEIVDAPEGTDVQAEIDPSTTNKLIRELLTKFRRSSYVGYTATPFANVLIPQDAQDHEVEDDLFPRDFMLSLSPRPGYVGTERLFGRDALDGEPEQAVPGLDVIFHIPNDELAAVSPKYAELRVADFSPAVPPSMGLAIRDWVLATAALTIRKGREHPSTMLIHIHQQTRVQNELADQVERVVSELRSSWRYDREGLLWTELRERWDTEFRPRTRRIKPEEECPFDDLIEHIDHLLRDPIPVLALNSNSEDELDFDRDPGLRGILIGGNRLSRGMTIEGLTVSFYVRETPYMDTLLQMGRWFGYREAYVDLTRLWTTPLLSGWFRDIALREEELRQVLFEAERERLTPAQAGVRIRSHPAMMVTSQAKQGAAHPIRISYSGTLIQTSRFRLWDTDWLQENLDATQELFSQLGAPVPADPSNLPVWQDVPAALVSAFLWRYRTVQSRRTFDADTAAEYIDRQVAEGELRRWTIAVRTQARAAEGLRPFPLGNPYVPEVNAIARTRLANDDTSIGVLTQPADPQRPLRGDEEIGLPLAAAEEARRLLAEGKHESLREALIAQRHPDNGLLVVYPISRNSTPRANSDGRRALFDDPKQGVDLAGAAILFPRSRNRASVTYIGNTSLERDLDEL